MRSRRARRRAPEPPPPLILELRRSGVEIEVPAHHTALEALEHSDIDIPSMCRAGVCGTCEMRPLAAEFASGAVPARLAPVRLCVTTGGAATRIALDL